MVEKAFVKINDALYVSARVVESFRVALPGVVQGDEVFVNVKRLVYVEIGKLLGLSTVVFPCHDINGR